MRNPIRRNKNIGKTQGGRVQDGRAHEKFSRVFTQDVWTQLSGRTGKWQVLRENPSRNFYHPCTGGDYIEVLKRLPEQLTDRVKAIVLRRTSKLDDQLGIDARLRYACVIMNAFPKSNQLVWRTRPSEATHRHLDPWCNNWLERGGAWKLIWSTDQVKRYYQYHVFLHEVGHLNQPAFHASSRREQFAENFALEWARKLGQL